MNRGAPLSSITISIVVPYYNANSCLKRLFVSLQDYALRDDIEIIIVNDCSEKAHTEALDEQVEQTRWPRLRVIHLAVNGGAAKARKTGIQVAKGEYIAFLDSDDAWASNKLDWQLAAMRKFDAVISGSACEQIEEGQLEQFRAESLHQYQVTDYFPLKALFYNAYSTPSVMLKRSVALQNPFNENMRYSEDVDCWRRILLQHKGIIINGPNAYMFKHAFLSDQGSLSSYTFKMSMAQLASLGRLLMNANISPKFKVLIPFAMVWAVLKAVRREVIVWRHRRGTR